MTIPALHGVLALVGLVATIMLAASDAATQLAPSRTQVVLLGTGNPGPSPERSGPATAIIVNGQPYLIDFGPGVVRRAAAAQQKGLSALNPINIKHAFVTHLHSDHTVGYPDLIFTPWVIGRKVPLEVYGPPGIKAMTDHVLAAWADDIKERSGPIEQAFLSADGYRVNAHEVSPGVVYNDSNVTVTAFTVKHGDWGPRGFGYRFQTPDRTIVISGDTSPSETVVEHCNGCDILIHEVYTEAGYHSQSSRTSQLESGRRPGREVRNADSFGATIRRTRDESWDRRANLPYRRKSPVFLGVTHDDLRCRCSAGADGLVGMASRQQVSQDALTPPSLRPKLK